ncbi:MAG: carbohydrate-binding protein [Lachnospiraceae bacterium]|nr:carbohydrate-binding protein [Lachnospiraceae bacterium]
MDLCFKILDAAMNTKAVSKGVDEVSLVYSQEYEPGDRIILETSGEETFVWLQMDDALGRALVYITGNVEYIIPFGEKRVNLSPKAFYGGRHLLHARLAKDYDVEGYRNLAINVYDQHQIKDCYPHAAANVETRGETVFAAQNAIDGVMVNTCHGEWPYQSWGIDRKEDARIRIAFGRTVEIDRIVLYTRADFPHDNWWRSVHFDFSDESGLEMQMEKSMLPHEITFPSRRVRWVEMNHMVKSDDPSPFPALTQIEVYGREAL